MKPCPYCKEDVRDDAIKCRYCQSSLLTQPAPATPPSTDDRVTYVVDQGFLRFAKFALGVLAIFLVVGAYTFGFKLEASLEKVQAVQEQAKTTAAELKASQVELQGATQTVGRLKAEVERLLAAAKATLGDIDAQKSAAIAMVVSIRELTPAQESKLQQAKALQPGKARGGVGRYWANGSTLRVRFLGGNLQEQKAVREAAMAWAAHANLKFEFVTNGVAEIRVAFDKKDGSWSFVGSDALVLPQDQPTMNFGWIDRHTTLHEFGHALGLIEEHQNPAANIAWNKEVVRRELSAGPNLWDEATIDENVFKKVAAESLGTYRDFDSRSVMIRAFPATWTGGVAIEPANDLTASDKALIARLYPR